MYSNEYCSGTPDYSYDITTVYPLNTLDTSEYTLICCSGNQCGYGNQTTYETYDCSADITTSYSYFDIHILGACYNYAQVGTSSSFATQYTSCSNRVLTSKSLSANCLGVPHALNNVSNGDCDQETGYQYGISCGVAIDTCTASTSSPSYGSFTPSPTTKWYYFLCVPIHF